MINQISTVARGAHPLSVVALAIALAALVIAIATFVTVNPILRLLLAAIAAILFRGPLRCSYTDRTEEAANQVKVVSALKGKHKRIVYRARLTRNQTLKKLKTQVTLVLHIAEKARFDYGPQQLTEFIYGSVRRGLLITRLRIIFFYFYLNIPIPYSRKKNKKYSRIFIKYSLIFSKYSCFSVILYVVMLLLNKKISQNGFNIKYQNKLL